MKKKLSISFIFLFGTLKLLACDCEWGGNFLVMAKDSEVVALVKVTKHNNFFELTGASPESINQPLSATFEIIEILSGKEDRKKIEVFGDVGNLCRPYIDRFKIGEYYVVALNKSYGIEHENDIIETKDDYMIWNCGEFWAEYSNSNQIITGYILEGKKKKRELSYSDFKEKLNNEKSL